MDKTKLETKPSKSRIVSQTFRSPGNSKSDWESEAPSSLVTILGIDSHTTALTTVNRPGHFDETHPLLKPRQDEDIINDLVPRNDLEKSSSSFLGHQQEPPSTASEDEAGQLECREFLCFGKKKHWVDPMYKDPGEADSFAAVLLLFTIVSYVPALCGVVFYESNNFRRFLIGNADWCWGFAALTMVVYFILNYFSGVTRRFPYHIFMWIAKSLCFGVGYTLACPCTEYLWIYIRIRLDPRFETQSEDVSLEYKLYTEYTLNTNEGYKHPGILRHHRTLMYTIAVIYTMAIQIITFLCLMFTKISIFGPSYPFVTYTVTFIIITTGSAVAVSESFGYFHPQHLLWNLVQLIIGPGLGLYMSDRFINYLEHLFNGKICPLKYEEFLYAVANY